MIEKNDVDIENLLKQIYDTKIDLAYASGYHVYASQRLAPYLMAEKLTSDQASEPHRSIFTPAYA